MALRGENSNHPRPAPLLNEAAPVAVHQARFVKTVSTREKRKPPLIAKPQPERPPGRPFLFTSGSPAPEKQPRGHFGLRRTSFHFPHVVSLYPPGSSGFPPSPRGRGLAGSVGRSRPGGNGTARVDYRAVAGEPLLAARELRGRQARFSCPLPWKAPYSLQEGLPAWRTRFREITSQTGHIWYHNLSSASRYTKPSW